MSVIILLIGCSLAVALLFLGAYLWAARSGQYDDDYTPSIRMLFDDELNQDSCQTPPKTSRKERPA
ncbi:MAG: cbb3-type cytochrome oxidase assembly protein CcoS [Cytophagales bacterium]|nr:cbb3-type cytochrome oxidase assembly protein CcoS [Cytophagales bacterium]